MKKDLYPSYVNPFNFNRGDAVKKMITDQMITPFIGVVTAIIPSTNKVEVQWPSGFSLEEPTDLIKVNPFFEPPVVNEDKAYPSYQKDLSNNYYTQVSPLNVMRDYHDSELQPMFLTAVNLYNNNVSKKEAYFKLSCKYDNSDLKGVVNKVYDDNINGSFYKEIVIDDKVLNASVKISGDSNSGYSVTATLGNDIKNQNFNTLQDAYFTFVNFKKMFSTNENEKIVKSVAQKLKNADVMVQPKLKPDDLKKVIRDDMGSKLECINHVEDNLLHIDQEVANTGYKMILEDSKKHFQILENMLKDVEREYMDVINKNKG